MRGFRFGWAIALAVVAAACADQTITGPELAKHGKRATTLAATTTEAPVCPAGEVAPLRWRTAQGQLIDAGTVTASNDPTTLYLRWDATNGYDLEYLYYWVGKSEKAIPRKSNGDVKLYDFQWSTEINDGKTYTATYSLGTYKPGDTLVVAAPADVEGPYTNPNGVTSIVYRLAYSGDRTIDQTTLGAPDNDAADGYAVYFNYVVKSCTTPADTTTPSDTTTPPDTTPADTTPPSPPAAGGVITVTFDDGFLDAYTKGFAELKKFGIVGNIAVNPGPIDEQWGDYMTLDMLNEMHTAGWAVVAHSWYHDDLTTLSDAALDADLKNTQDWIRARGYRGANIFVVPFHSWGAREETAIRKYYTATRGHSVYEFWPDSMVKYPTSNPYGLTGYEPEYAPYTTAEGRAATRAVMQKAVDEGKFVDIFFHQIPDANLAAFREMVTIIAEFKPYIRTYPQLFPGS